MDLNTLPGSPWSSLEDGPYELASYALHQKTRLLILANNWLLSEQPKAPGDDGKHDWNTLEYWAARLRPLWARGEGGGEEEKGEETIVVVCNRSGVENGESLPHSFSFLHVDGAYSDHPGITFAGTSCIFSMSRNSGRPKLLDMMGKEEEGVRVWNITV
jgi:protein N-terminal amidase